jgi:hypothetical protein
MRRPRLLADIGDHEFNGTVVQDVMVGIGRFHEHPMRAGGQVPDDDWDGARICPVPGQVVHRDVEVSDARRNRERRRAEHRHDPDVLGAALKQPQTA